MAPVSCKKFTLPPCRVCGDRAAGFHYGANTCEACKGFFHRSLRRKGEYKCTGTGRNCEVKPGKQRSCPKCRYKRCLEAGMSRAAIKTGRYTYVKRSQDILEVQRLHRIQALVRAQHEELADLANTPSPPPAPTPQSTPDPECQSKRSPAHGAPCNTPIIVPGNHPDSQRGPVEGRGQAGAPPIGGNDPVPSDLTNFLDCMTTAEFDPTNGEVDTSSRQSSHPQLSTSSPASFSPISTASPVTSERLHSDEDLDMMDFLLEPGIFVPTLFSPGLSDEEEGIAFQSIVQEEVKDIQEQMEEEKHTYTELQVRKRSSEPKTTTSKESEEEALCQDQIARTLVRANSAESPYGMGGNSQPGQQSGPDSLHLANSSAIRASHLIKVKAETPTDPPRAQQKVCEYEYAANKRQNAFPPGEPNWKFSCVGETGSAGWACSASFHGRQNRECLGGFRDCTDEGNPCSRFSSSQCSARQQQHNHYLRQHHHPFQQQQQQFYNGCFLENVALKQEMRNDVDDAFRSCVSSRGSWSDYCCPTSPTTPLYLKDPISPPYLKDISSPYCFKDPVSPSYLKSPISPTYFKDTISPPYCKDTSSPTYLKGPSTRSFTENSSSPPICDQSSRQALEQLPFKQETRRADFSISSLYSLLRRL